MRHGGLAQWFPTPGLRLSRERSGLGHVSVADSSPVGRGFESLIPQASFLPVSIFFCTRSELLPLTAMAAAAQATPHPGLDQGGWIGNCQSLVESIVLHRVSIEFVFASIHRAFYIQQIPINIDAVSYCLLRGPRSTTTPRQSTGWATQHWCEPFLLAIPQCKGFGCSPCRLQGRVFSLPSWQAASFHQNGQLGLDIV